MTTKGSLLNILKEQKKGYSLARPFYKDEKFFASDMKHIWYKSWVFAGHPCEVPKVGDYFTFTLGEYPIVVIRMSDKEEDIQAFHLRNIKNSVIKHTLKEQINGSVKLPKRVTQKLTPIHCKNVCYYLFISLAKKPDDIAPLEKDVSDYIAPYNLDKLKIASSSTIIEQGNWKLVMENNRECYHCSSNHPELIITFPEDPSVTGIPSEKTPKILRDCWEKCEAMNMPSRFLMSEDGTYRVTRVPLLNGFTSFTMDGKAAVKKRVCHAEDPDIGSLLYFHYPSSWNHFLGDQVISFRLIPLTAQKTLLTTKWMINKDAIEGKDYTIERLRYVWDQTNLQDRHLVEQNQLGINSPDYLPGPYSAEYETGVAQFVDWYSNTLQKRLPTK
jgi:Rieske 2Fe-2S family protein